MYLSDRIRAVLIIVGFFLIIPAIQYTINFDLVLKNPPRYNPEDPVISLSNIYAARPYYNETEISLLIHDEVNRVRVERGELPLKYDEGLARNSYLHSIKLQQANDIFHSNHPEENVIFDVIINRQFSFSYLITKYNSEFEISKELVNGWMKSPFHASNILDARMTKEGIGVSQKGISIYATQQFS